LFAENRVEKHGQQKFIVDFILNFIVDSEK